MKQREFTARYNGSMELANRGERVAVLVRTQHLRDRNLPRGLAYRVRQTIIGTMADRQTYLDSLPGVWSDLGSNAQATVIETLI